MKLTKHVCPRPHPHPLFSGASLARIRRTCGVAMVLAAFWLVAAPASAQVLTPSDPGFWVTLPNGGIVPYNHPLATGAGSAPPAPRPTTRIPPPTAILTPSDPGFWVTLPNGGMVPYNHPAAIAAAAAGQPPSSTPAPAPAAAPAPDPQQPDVTPQDGGTRLRVLQWNLHHGVGSDGRYDIGRIASWMARMKPDVITLNEVEKNTWWGREDQPARYKALMEQLTGTQWYALFSQEFGDWSANGKGHLILSKYPFDSTARETLSYDRVVGAAGINVNGRTVNLIVTHLDPDSRDRRLTQAKQVSAWAANLAENRILTGDMNAWPDQTSIAEFTSRYRDSWTDATNNGTAAQPSGLPEPGATRNGRIDYIFYSKGSSNLSVLRSQVYDTRDAQGVMPSDHRPVLTTFDVR